MNKPFTQRRKVPREPLTLLTLLAAMAFFMYKVTFYPPPRGSVANDDASTSSDASSDVLVSKQDTRVHQPFRIIPDNCNSPIRGKFERSMPRVFGEE